MTLKSRVVGVTIPGWGRYGRTFIPDRPTGGALPVATATATIVSFPIGGRSTDSAPVLGRVSMDQIVDVSHIPSPEGDVAVRPSGEAGCGRRRGRRRH